MSLVFECKYCPATFPNFKGLVLHYGTRHNEKGEQYRSFQDAVNYARGDSGCQRATNHLGYQSSCLRCPFPKCVFDEKGVGIATVKKRNRNEEIAKLSREGKQVAEIVEIFGISRRTVQRVLAKGYQSA